MKFFWKYVFPPLYGLMVYFTIRLLLDTVTGMRFWHRAWKWNVMEWTLSIVTGYLLIAILHRLFRYFDRSPHPRILRELGLLVLVSTIFQNAIWTPFAALTDDGLQWYDLADINIIPLLYALIYYGVYHYTTFLEAYVASKLALEKITNDRLQTELRFLKAQFHPHFLFNALNTVYFQIGQNADDARRTIERLSELLRYQLYDQNQTVPVRRELDYLMSFIELQQQRMNEHLRLEVHFDPALGEQLIYPLLLLPLVENAFKYAGGEYWIAIRADLDGDRLAFKVRNAVPSALHTAPGHNGVPQKAHGGIGLENLRRRLDLLYPGGYEFEAGPEGDQFSTLLKLPL